MSTRLVELIVRGMGRFRGGLNMTTVLSMAFFSGISGSKLADVAAVGGVLMPAVRRAKQDGEEAAGVFAASAVMAETIPPCVNLIVMGFVANISIGALFIAGLVPAACLLVLLMIAANRFGGKINVSEAYPVLRPRAQLYLGAAVGLVMIFMIGRGVMMGIATSTEISAFAVIYAIVIGRLAFRELTFKATVKMFIDIAAMSGVLLFIVACATSLSYALTIQMIPQQIAGLLVGIGVEQGAWLFLLLTIVILIIFGAVLEGAPALIIFAPILVPIAVQLGFNPAAFRHHYDSGNGLWAIFTAHWAGPIYHLRHLRRGDEARDPADGEIPGGGSGRHHYRGDGAAVNHLAAGAGGLLSVALIEYKAAPLLCRRNNYPQAEIDYAWGRDVHVPKLPEAINIIFWCDESE
ncbi:Neu5Ac permease [Raoultella terrigena]|uniref:Neu5Ac permease n=1 Tax=Raoultella terrigena TaxID=577 RepID=A0A4U9D9N5_RAOTE|nr:Neu5Ac permease [Raoultella terrigena]